MAPAPGPGGPTSSPRRRGAALFGSLLGVACFLGALWLLHRELAAYHYRDVAAAVAAVPRGRLALALLATAASHLLLTAHDTLALHYLRRPLPYRRTAFASFLGQAVSHNAGHSLLSGGSLRYRLYSGWGLSAVEVAAVVGFCDAALWLGYAALGGIAFLMAPPPLPGALHLPLLSTRPLGALLLLAVAGFLAWCGRRRRPLRVRGWELRLPPVGLASTATAISALDWGLAAVALYVLLPPLHGLGLPGFVAVYLLAQVAGLLSQVPAGIGVFETVMLLLLAPTGVPRTAVLGALLIYRAIYYLLPLCVAAVLLGAHELLRHRRGVKRAATSLSWVPPLVPNLFAFTTFVAGAVLLFSGATPAELERLRLLRDVLPLPVIEFSHFLGSLVGVTLLLLARGLQRRLDAAYLLTCVLLAAGIVFSLAKGVDFEEAILLAVMLAALLPCRPYFYRKADLAVPRLSAGWVLAICLVLVCAAWLGIFSFKHVEYSGELWWQFALRADAPRALRATVGALIAVLAFGLARLLRPAPLERSRALADPPGVQAIVARSPATMANLALVGDKELLLSATGSAFLMFGVAGRSWIALGDPVGPAEEQVELVWRFREMVDRHGGWTVFYQVSAHALPLYLDLGLTLQKIGEEARVLLAAFSLDGQERKKLRNAMHRLEREGCHFEVVPAAAVPGLLPQLRPVSDAWLHLRSTREKGFSLGHFDEAYLARFPAALVRNARGEVLAFANLWLGGDGEELSFDLMRHRPEAPAGIMESLIAHLMLWGRTQGYRWCNLGMAPLSGLESRALAPLWTRLGALLFRHGEPLYNFQGVRQFKDKFDPVWEPRYLASPGGVALPRILAHLSSLIAGGFKGVVAK
ncbi:MAG TPA: bifunctional lysylphosphatidylglycerol flippase/synthetase MprF [Thermoanaerobaculia bacterium]|jgi:phosphatidylglycerol lysyltransferase|nr:bifunctional lysylphosphatidylglycerol flippase/synthetase MprF [Thermoanaerobaculia bacterium]